QPAAGGIRRRVLGHRLAPDRREGVTMRLATRCSCHPGISRSEISGTQGSLVVSLANHEARDGAFRPPFDGRRAVLDCLALGPSLRASRSAGMTAEDYTHGR